MPSPQMTTTGEISEARESSSVQCHLWCPSNKGVPQTTFAEWITKTKKKRGGESEKQSEKLDICYILKDHYILHLSTCWVQTTGQTVVAHCLIYRDKYYTAPVFQKYIKLKSFLSCLIPMPLNTQHCTAVMLKIFIIKKKKKQCWRISLSLSRNARSFLFVSSLTLVA